MQTPGIEELAKRLTNAENSIHQLQVQLADAKKDYATGLANLQLLIKSSCDLSHAIEVHVADSHAMEEKLVTQKNAVSAEYDANVIALQAGIHP